MKIRIIEEQDNLQVEQVIRTCLMEFGLTMPGCAWEDPDLGRFFQVYAPDNCCYWVAEEEGVILGGCGIGPLPGQRDVCELQKMYCLEQARGTGIAGKLLALALDFAGNHYQQCYLETFHNMEAANRFYIKHGFRPLDGPLAGSEHYACDRWYLKNL